MDAALKNIYAKRILTTTNKCAIMVLPNIGKDSAMDEHETKEEVLEFIFNELSHMTEDQLKEFVLFASKQGIELTKRGLRG